MYSSPTLVNRAPTSIEAPSQVRLRDFSFQGLPLLLVLFGNDGTGGHLIHVVTIRKEDSLRDGENR